VNLRLLPTAQDGGKNAGHDTRHFCANSERKKKKKKKPPALYVILKNHNQANDGVIFNCDSDLPSCKFRVVRECNPAHFPKCPQVLWKQFEWMVICYGSVWARTYDGVVWCQL
jgi:hypothetical protein